MQGLFGNRFILAAIVLTTSPMLLAVYLPVFQRILKTAPPSPTEWLIVAAAALVPTSIIEMDKIWQARPAIGR